MITKATMVGFMIVGAILLTACGRPARSPDAIRAVEEFREVIAYDQRMCAAGNGGSCLAVKDKLLTLRAIDNNDLVALRNMCNPMNISACEMYAAVSGKNH